MYGTIRINIGLRVSSARIESRVVEMMREIKRRRWRRQRLLSLLMLAQIVVLGFVDEEKDGTDAGELGADEAANVEQK